MRSDRTETDGNGAGPVEIVSSGEASPAEIAAILARGGTVVLPTETVYGLAVAADDPAGVQRVFTLKGRPPRMNLPIVVGSVDQIERLGFEITPVARRLADRFWPGPLTIVMGFRPDGPRPAWLDGREEAAIRFPDPSLLREIALEGGPFLMTSANKHGDGPHRIARSAARSLSGPVDLVVDAGELSPVPSTIVNVRQSPPLVERSGAISVAELDEVLGRGTVRTKGSP